MTTKQVTLVAVATSLTTVAITAALLWVAGVAGAGPLASNGGSVPRLINYQGRLTDAAGNPLTGSYNMTFCLYEVATGGTPLWCETQAVNVTYGVFNALLGSVTPIPATAFGSTNLYLGVRVGSDSEMTPRRRVVSVGYAYKAEDANNADTVDGLHASSTAVAGALFPLDVSSKFPNSVLYTGHGNGLDADTVDGIDASSTPTAGALLPLDASGKFPSSVLTTTVSGCGWFYSGSCPAGWTQVTTGEWGACVWPAMVGAGPGGPGGSWEEAILRPAGASTCPIGNYRSAGTAVFCCGAVATGP
jgi:hypothetical protein